MKIDFEIPIDYKTGSKLFIICWIVFGVPVAFMLYFMFDPVDNVPSNQETIVIELIIFFACAGIVGAMLVAIFETRFKNVPDNILGKWKCPDCNIELGACCPKCHNFYPDKYHVTEGKQK